MFPGFELDRFLTVYGLAIMKPEVNTAMGFPTTHWTRVLDAGRGETDLSRQALEDLCRIYWTPLYAFLRRQGQSPDDAKDLTQGFLARVIAREDLGQVGPEKGKFRTFLLTSLRNFTIKQALRDKAQKRGGAAVPLTIDGDEGERLCGPDLSAESPELAFDRRWCRTVLGQALRRLQEEQRARGKQAMFEVLSRFLDGADPGDYEVAAAQLGTTSGALAVTIHRLRSRLQELIRCEVAQTVGSADRLDEEMRYLMEVWRQ